MPVKRILRKFGLRGPHSIFSPARQHPRVQLATEVKVEAFDLSFTARSVQLGTNGMSLEQAGRLSLAQPVQVSFVLPSGSRVRVSAVVRWKKNEMVGLRFDPREHHRELHEWVQESSEDALNSEIKSGR